MSGQKVAKGYKQTEVGVIPEDWEIRRIIDCADYVDYRGKTPKKTNLGILLVTARNIKNGFIDYEVSREYVSEYDYDLIMRRGKPKLGDILITTEAPVGNVARVDREDIALAQRVIKYRAKGELLSSQYFKHYLLGDLFKKILDANTSGSTAQGIKGSVLHTLEVVLPPIAEQKQIARALSDIDALIEGLEGAIGKKRQIKQGAMQELLSGKRRLSGFGEGKGYEKSEIGIFPEDWPVVPLGILIGSLDAGVSVNSADRDKDIFSHGKSILKTSCVLAGKFDPEEHKSILPQDLYRAKLNPRKDSIIISRMNTPLLVGECGYVENDYPNLFLPDRLWMTRPIENQNYCSRWLAYLLSFSSFNRAIKDSATGTSGSMKNISQGSFFSVQIPRPIKEEQQAIATILSDMDNAIATLEAKLIKTRQLKQGMMHELLTGRIRLA
jgi:type I restriction enzyme, S subunit